MIHKQQNTLESDKKTAYVTVIDNLYMRSYIDAIVNNYPLILENNGAKIMKLITTYPKLSIKNM